MGKLFSKKVFPSFSIMKYTPAQEKAVLYGDGNLLLSAAAGSGKTAALTGRISELLISERAELSEMLIVTYTRAAAAEMRSRLSRRLRELSAEGHRVGRHLAALPSADISTIHSFLYKSLRPYFPSLGLSPDYRIIDTSTVRTMKIAAMRDVVDDFFSRNDRFSRNDGHSHNESDKKSIVSFAELADVFAGARDSTSLDKQLLRIADFLVSSAEDHTALGRYADALDEVADHGTLRSPHGSVLCGSVASFTNHYFKIFSDFEDDFPNYPKVNEKYGANLTYILDFLHRVTSSLSTTYDELAGVFRSFALPRLGTIPSKEACDISEEFKFHRDRLKGDVKHIAELFFPFTEEGIITSAHKTAAVLRRTEEVIAAYFDELDKRKRAASALEYSDLETLAIRLFIKPDGTPTAAAREVGGKYKYLFIDEYQDTNGVQDKIFRAVSETCVRFMVGDIKQSIYRFRGAEPEVFAEYRRNWRVIAPDEAEEISFSPDDGRSLFMSENFRCAEPVVKFVNMVSDYTLPHGGIPYDTDDALIHARDEKNAPPVEVRLIECPRKSAGDDDENNTERPKNPEAVYIARRIRDMLGRYSPGGEYVIHASDIAILLRSPSPKSAVSVSAEYEAALAEYGIPVKRKTSRSLTSYASVKLILCLLNVVDNPLRDIPTAGAMRSPIFGFTSADIVTLRSPIISGDSDLPLYTVCERIHDGEIEVQSTLRNKCTLFVEWARHHRQASRAMPSDKYLEFLTGDVHLFAAEGIRGDGNERGAVNRLCMLARTYEGSGETGNARFGGVSGFLSYLADTDGEGGDEAAPENEDAVSIMSIHTSKGLEFPICFLAECSKKRNAADERGDVLLDRELGIGMCLPDDGGLIRCGSFLRCATAEKMRVSSTEEEMRMLYVALTRARDRLIVTAKVPDTDKSEAEANIMRSYADDYYVSSSATYIKWIIGAAARHGADDFYNISSIPESALLTESEVEHPVENSEVSATDTALPDISEVEDRFSFEYPHRHLSKIPAKLSVSGLYPEILDEGAISDTIYELTDDGFAPVVTEDEIESGDDVSGTSDKPEENGTPRPRFMTGANEISGAKRGSATHVFLQFANFARLYETGAEAELKRLVDERYMSETMAELVNMRQLKKFVKSDLFDSLRRSRTVRREFRFNARMPAERFTSDEELRRKLREDEVKITVQGVVDCVYRSPDSGRLVLVDYKTDSLTEEEYNNRALAEKKLTLRHRNQLMYYREICEKMFGERIDDVMIYSTVLGECVRV